MEKNGMMRSADRPFLEAKFGEFLTLLTGEAGTVRHSYASLCRKMGVERRIFDDFLFEETGMYGEDIMAVF